MCGIAGYSLNASSAVDRTLAAQALLAAISERGADAVGYAYRAPGMATVVVKQRSAASDLLDSMRVPHAATEALIHVRDYTKGHPSLGANNHPIRHGAVVGIHNGIIVNDEELFSRRGWQRAEPGMTVDSEAIFALVDEDPGRPEVLEELYGALATAWLDDRSPGEISLVRGIGRPLWIGEGEHEFLFASTRDALELTETYAGLALEKREVSEGSALTVSAGRVVSTYAFRADAGFREEVILPSVRAPQERASCLRRLAVLAAAGGV